ncbi:hypothetical protein OVN20_10370 [Microcella daejeonensis]|uniref:hypothetical protein n=1 Tax=Microcella daejeonensis TaxID=2994971 RepID=UPI00226EDFC3|nr:hypothetical protein [Microcella daejeonensis]WAB83458.1 hypothetical protein OVN20_10370 [Microcella daejeonensis]
MTDNASMMSGRDAALRAALVALATERPQPRRARPGITVLSAVLAFGLAGVGTGAAVAATSSAPENRTVIDVNIAEMAQANLESATPLFGAPVIVTGMGTTVLDLGGVPAGATALAVRLNCLDDGRFDIEIDGEREGWLECDGEPGQAGYFSQFDVAGDGSRSVSIVGDDDGRYELWVAWSAPPAAPEASGTQQEALADGVVTREEYLAGLDRYQACIEAAGWFFMVVDRDAPIVEFSFEAGAVGDGSDLRCYAAEFEQVDIAWQISQG